MGPRADSARPAEPRGSGMPAGARPRWLPSIELGATLAALSAGILPALAIAFSPGGCCRHRPAWLITDTA
ncbi:hypothetical protein B1992_09260 [Pseudoxanthomonas broegbernensis]|uniref:Uncharacterized protein n=1 Tax=Pseudoxanthomonas broegbernensis TaxID=83619 RepID=A0A7V8GM23_9GAMM|nr:hypothetical protein B1992_09260 [Pseudoxanthomonas broegbernensis]MBB6063816.1 hypothetical protein [Pseudoxanthomonas broegbernensis]